MTGWVFAVGCAFLTCVVGPLLLRFVGRRYTLQLDEARARLEEASARNEATQQAVRAEIEHTEYMKARLEADERWAPAAARARWN